MATRPTRTPRRQTEAYHRFILQSIQEYAIFTLDSRAHITTWTPAAHRILGLTEADVLGQHWSLLFTPEDRAAGTPEATLKLARHLGTASEEQWCLRKDGSRFWAGAAVSVLTDARSRRRGFVAVLRDGTARTLAEHQFLARVSHELRTPLTAILLWAKLLENRPDCPPDELRQGLQAIKVSAEAQAELIDRLLHSPGTAAPSPHTLSPPPQ